MALVEITLRQRKVKTDQQGHVATPATDITYEGDSAEVNPDNVVMVKPAGTGEADEGYFLVTMVNGHTFYVDTADKQLLNV